jgi:hypothetical protein
MLALNPNPLDPGAIAGLGIGMVIVGLIIYLGIIALTIWIGYLIMRTAVKNGVIRAMQETGAQITPRGYSAPQAPASGWRPNGS